jgi:hypothetical protein
MRVKRNHIVNWIILVLLLFFACSKIEDKDVEEKNNSQPYVDKIWSNTHDHVGNALGVVAVECDKGEEIVFSASGIDEENDALSFFWKCDKGYFSKGNTSSSVTWVAPEQADNCGNTDWYSHRQRVVIVVYVKDEKHPELLDDYTKAAWVFVDCKEIYPPELSNEPSEYLAGKYTYMLSYTIDADNSSDITDAGICYNTIGDPDLSDNIEQDDSPRIGTNLIGLIGLTPNTTYYARAFATNEAGTSFSPSMSFTTKKDCNVPSVEVTETNIYTIDCPANRYLKAKIENYVDENILNAGVVWSSTNNTPTLEDSYSVFDGSFTSNGEFKPTLSDLQPNTKYYFRLYAENDCGVDYGTVYYYTVEDYDPDDCNGASNEDCEFETGTINGGYSYNVNNVYVVDNYCDIRMEVNWKKETAGEYGKWIVRFYNLSNNTITVWFSAMVTDGSEVEDWPDYSMTLEPGENDWYHYYIENSGTLKFYEIKVEKHNRKKSTDISLEKGNGIFRLDE